MTTIQRPNKNDLVDACDIYRDAMRPFLLRALRRVRGSSLLTTIKHALPAHQRNMFDTAMLQNGESEAGALDIGMFPHLVSVYWREVFYEEFRKDRTACNQIWMIKKARNTAAHPGTTDMDVGYTYSRLTDIADVLGRINALEAKNAVEAIRNRVSRRSIAQYLKSQQGIEAITDSDTKQEASSPPRTERKQAVRRPIRETAPDTNNQQRGTVADATEQFAIYEDDPTNRARIHRADCRWYVNRKDERLPDNRWYHGFYTLKDAESAMSDLSKRDSRRCGHCMR